MSDNKSLDTPCSMEEVTNALRLIPAHMEDSLGNIIKRLDFERFKLRAREDSQAGDLPVEVNKLQAAVSPIELAKLVEFLHHHVPIRDIARRLVFQYDYMTARIKRLETLRPATASSATATEQSLKDYRIINWCSHDMSIAITKVTEQVHKLIADPDIKWQIAGPPAVVYIGGTYMVTQTLWR